MQKRLILVLTVLFFNQYISFGQSEEKLIDKINTILQNEIDQGHIPGAVIFIKQGDNELYKNAFGYAHLYKYGNQRLQKPEKTTVNYLYDIASLTKVIGTTTAIMLLVDKGLITADDKVSNYIKAFDTPEKKDITIRHLLTHTSGLYEWYPFYYYSDNREDTYKIIGKLPLKYVIGSGRHYSDLGFMLLGQIIETVSEHPLDEFMQQHIFKQLEMEHTLFNPLEKKKDYKIAATSHGNPFETRMVTDASLGFKPDSLNPTQWNGWRHYTLKGEVNDGNTWYANEGVSGHAGLFSSVGDLQKLIDVLKHNGKTQYGQFITKKTINQFLTQDEFKNGLGWVMNNNSAILKSAPKGSFGHTGFTGTSIAVVPKYNISVILLINRQNMGLLKTKSYYNLNPVREKVFRAVMKYCETEHLDKRITKFEEVLGKTNSKTLTFLVRDFENNYLKSNYPNSSIQEAYKEYLSDIKQGNSNYAHNTTKEAQVKFKNSQLRKDLYYVPDSIWIEGDVVKEKVLFWNNVDKPYYSVNESYIMKTRMHLTNDSIIKYRLKNLNRFRIYGKYMNALRAIKNKDQMVKHYVQDKEAFGFISHKILAEWFLELKLDYNDYIYKRIIILEFAY
ncbi:serine hydrolase domain-containing protein [Aureibaculum conchae]|uniref:serine hydrolase domain-containing protein n=1 Tax=Aureibaculum sp. 2308TA14-22 TaxID=3108392 RepID=UPI0033951C3F